MKKLQNNFTTPEQSKRLLELGVPAWSADCYYYEEGGVSSNSTPQVISFGQIWEDNSVEMMFSSYIDIPCWSVGRLIEIWNICVNLMLVLGMQSELDKERENCTYIELIISSFESAADDGLLDFSKLED